MARSVLILATSAMWTRLFATLALGLVMTIALPARAQTLTLPNKLERETELRPTNQRPYWISFDDCLEDDVLHFDTTLTGVTTDYRLEVWVSGASAGDCTLDEQRSVSGRCALVYSASPTDDQWRVSIRVQDIVARNAEGDMSKGPGSGTVEDCRVTQDGQGTITLYFLLFDAGGAIASQGKWTDTGIDVVGPAAPDDVNAGTGENQLFVRWDPTIADDLSGYRLYCERVDASSLEPGLVFKEIQDAAVPMLDAGFAGSFFGGDASPTLDGAVPIGTGGSGGGVPAGPQCGETMLIPGEFPDPALECGSTGVGTRGTARGLTNGAVYAVAVAAVDDIGNVGTLSQVDCGQPEIVDDFYELYRRAGGEGGGGFCAVNVPGSSKGWLVAVAAMAGLLIRRGRR